MPFDAILNCCKMNSNGSSFNKARFEGCYLHHHRQVVSLCCGEEEIAFEENLAKRTRGGGAYK